jgi:ABC-type transporter Mla subunit MlaD
MEAADILSAPARKRLKKALSQVQRHTKVIADRRDKLRELAREIEEISDSIDEGLEDISRGTDALSRYV